MKKKSKNLYSVVRKSEHLNTIHPLPSPHGLINEKSDGMITLRRVFETTL